MVTNKLEQAPNKGNVSNWKINVDGNISKNPLPNGNYLQTINVKIIRSKDDLQLTMDISTEYHININGKITDTLNDENFIQYSELMLVSISHAQAIFWKSCQDIEINVGFFPPQRAEKYFHDLKNGYYALWN
ncbi:hypothetical protein HDE68_004987 [Pedobacter cryoconitis]|uniref:Uncharacterized protein n=1 Tax=Pedobacter cryoconitis TaxID=188932 RepID=A0A7W8ZRV6_9SPHI|nr:hypothetical protein [Pedobacter cryoconitis]MBB5639049.1 hypothetical protein [Pedobacter cryoconitis]